VDWQEKNFGTEKVEEELDKELKGYRIARMDLDSVRGKHAHDTLIQQFEKHQLDVLVGTQMVVKGLDFEKVKLVGILDADALWSFSDFRAHERAFQLMEQVSGRAGRKGETGHVCIQALNVQHPVLQWVKNHDFISFYQSEIEARKTFLYPPFVRLLKITLRHADRDLVATAAQQLANSLRQDFEGYVTGPARPHIARLRNQYHEELMLKIPKTKNVSVVKKAIRHHMALLQADKKYKSVRIIADVDPH
jgi:primosomal protein N' (replication factor Y)